jgi:hypothetical protein
VNRALPVTQKELLNIIFSADRNIVIPLSVSQSAWLPVMRVDCAKTKQRTKIIITPLQSKQNSKLHFLGEKQQSNVKSLLHISLRANFLQHKFRTIIKQPR